MNRQALSSLIWSVANLLRGDFKQSEYGRVTLLFTVLRRLDCVLAPTKGEVLEEHAAKQAAGIAFEPFVKRKAGLDFYNVSSLDMGKLMGDQDQLARPGQRDHGRRDGRGERAHGHEQAWH